MKISQEKNQHQIHIGSEILTKVEQFRYLEVTISEDCQSLLSFEQKFDW